MGRPMIWYPEPELLWWLVSELRVGLTCLAFSLKEELAPGGAGTRPES